MYVASFIKLLSKKKSNNNKTCRQKGIFEAKAVDTMTICNKLYAYSNRVYIYIKYSIISRQTH